MKVGLGLKDCIIFRGLSGEQIKLAKRQLDGTTNSYKKNEIVIKENEIVKNVGIVVKGSVSMSKFTIDGREILLQKLISSHLVGADIAFTRKQDSPYTIYSNRNTDIHWFPINKITELGILDNDIRMIMLSNIMYFIADENIRKYYKIEYITTKGVRERIIRYLVLQQKRTGSNSFHIKFNREELANFLGVNRSVLSHELKQMEKEGMIAFKKDYFEIINL